MVNHFQNVLDAAVPRVGILGPFPSSFMLTLLHARIILSAMVEVGAFN